MPAITATITALPTAPDPTTMTPQEFNLAAAAHVAALPAFGSELNSLASQINTATAAVNFAGSWSTLTGAVSVPTSVEHNGSMYLLLQNLANVTTQTPGAAPTYWRPIETLTRTARTSTFNLSGTERGTLQEITSGTFTVTFTAAASLTSSWFCWLKNSGTGDITIDPNGTDTVDNLLSFVMYPGEMRLFTSDGVTALFSVVINPFLKTFTASGTFTRPPGYQMFRGLAWSGGASGQRTNSNTTLSVGGAGGACQPFDVLSSALAASETIVVGAESTAVTTVAAGNPGNLTSMTKNGAAWLVVTGATHTSGGFWQIAAGGSTNTSADSAINFAGGLGATTGRSSLWGGASPSTNASTDSGSSLHGGGAGGSLDAGSIVKAAGSSQNGGAGGAAVSTSNGVAGTAPGGGGGATQTGTSSGAGARGELRIWGVM